MALKLKVQCLICKKLGANHHVLHQGPYPEYKDEIWNQCPVCVEHHIEWWHKQGTVFMANRFPVVLKWLLKNEWKYNETAKKWWPKVWWNNG